MPTGIKVEISGPLFDRGNPILKKWATRFVKVLLEIGEDRLNDVLRPRPAGVFLSVSEAKKGRASKGIYRQKLKRDQDGLSGLLHDSNWIYGPWLEGTSDRNKSTRFKGYASFRKTRDWLDKRKDKVGDALKHKIIRELTG
jgi:hypothetical protein